LKILFFGASAISVFFLEKLYTSEHKIEAVITNVDKETGRGKKIIPNPVKTKAQELGLKHFEIHKIDDGIYEIMHGLVFDGLVIVSFGHIIPQKLIDLSNDRAINVHPSLLPKYRGPSPITSALINGDEETGVSIMKINKDLDAGSIFTQNRFKISASDNHESLENKIIEMGAPLLISVLNLIDKNLIESFPQTGTPSYTKVFRKEDLKIDWTGNSNDIRNKIKAFSPEPGAYTFLNNQRIKILNASEYYGDGEHYKKIAAGNEYNPGDIIYADKINGLIVKCGSSEAVRILDLKIESKNKISFLDFLNGYKIKTGDYFK
jgi:methionyl-tRNA formyltransferase